MSVLPSPSKSAGVILSVESPNLVAENPLADWLRYQTESDGRKTETSDLPSPSKSTLAFGNDCHEGCEFLPVMSVICRESPPARSFTYISGPLDTEKNAIARPSGDQLGMARRLHPRTTELRH